MNKTVKIIVIFLLVDVLAVGGYFLFKAIRGGKSGTAEVPWITIDEAFQPSNAVEEFIQTDARNRGALPVYIKAYGHDAKVLKKFRGRQFAQPTENVLALFFKGMDDWMIVDIKFKTENEREIVRTMLYVFVDKQWRVGDSGTLVD